MPVTTRIAGTAAFLVLIVLSGLWLSLSGKPLSSAILNIHKIIGLLGGAFLGLIVYQTHQAAPLQALEIAAIAVTVVIFVGAVAAGGALSLGKPMPAVVLRLHQILPGFAVLSAAGTLYLLLTR